MSTLRNRSMPRRNRYAGTTTAILLILMSACSMGGQPQSGHDDLVLTLAPADSSIVLDPFASPAARYPPGSRVVLARADGGLRVLSQGIETAGAPALSPAADEVLFTGRRPGDERWRVWRVPVRGGAPVALSDPLLDCIEPTFLAAGRVAFACTEPPGAEPANSVWSLYTAPRTGAAERVTFGPGSARAPTALRDGRILFLMERFGEERASGLFTVNPDGTLLEAFTDDHDVRHRPLRARPTGDGSVLVLMSDSTSLPGAYRLDVGAPLASTTRIHLPETSPTAAPVAVEPAGGGGVLVAYAPPARSIVYRQDQHGWSVAWKPQGDAYRVIEVLVVSSHRAPHGRPRNVDPHRRVGYLLCYDARRSDGSVGPPADSPAPARVHIDTMREGQTQLSSNHGHDLDAAMVASLGQAAVHEDGSFFVEVPADVPLRLATLDARGHPVGRSDWFWVRPGEVRACFGCHESRTTAPVNAPVRAIEDEPVRLGATATSARPAAERPGDEP